MKFQLIFATCILLLSCQSGEIKKKATKTSQPKPDSEIAANKALLPETFCYKYFNENTSEQDSIVARFTVDGHKVSGILDCVQFMGKYNGRFSVLGVMDGGIITGIANPLNKSKRRKEEVIFKMTDEYLTQKVVELEMSEGILKMKNPETGVFRDTLFRVDCED
ncbi:MAG: hypothetical protein ACI9XO_004394 [Paraglaciecola sp.]|jgi:hypothetical protein